MPYKSRGALDCLCTYRRLFSVNTTDPGGAAQPPLGMVRLRKDARGGLCRRFTPPGSGRATGGKMGCDVSALRGMEMGSRLCRSENPFTLRST